MNNKQISKLSIILFLIFTCVLAPSLVFAGDTPQPDTLSRIVDYFYTQTKSWASVIEGKAISLFAILLLIDVAWLGIRLAIKRSSITETLTEFTQLILFAGFMYGLITHYTDWTASFVEGLLGVAKDIGAPKAEPAAIFGTGISLISTAFSKISYTNLSVSVGLVISSIIICICFAMISAQLILVRCESYIVLNAGMILLGFGGSAFTKEFAFNFMKYALSVAVKLYVMQLLVALGLSFFYRDYKGR